MARVEQCVLLEAGRPARRVGRLLLHQQPDVVATLDRLEDRLEQAGLARLPAGRPDAENDVPLAVLTLDSGQRDVRAEGRNHTPETVAQVGPSQPARELARQEVEHLLRRMFFEPVAPPPGAHQGVALDALLEPAQDHRLAHPPGRQPRRGHRTEGGTFPFRGLQIGLFLRHPVGKAGPDGAKAHPATDGLGPEGAEREVGQGVLFGVEQHPALGGDRRFGARPGGETRLDDLVPRQAPALPALDGLADAGRLGGVIVPTGRPAGGGRQVGARRRGQAGPAADGGVVGPRPRQLGGAEQTAEGAAIPGRLHRRPRHSGHSGSSRTRWADTSIEAVSSTWSS